MKKVVILAFAIMVISALAFSATAMGGFSKTGCGNLAGKPGFNVGDPAYEALCNTWPIAPLL